MGSQRDSVRILLVDDNAALRTIMREMLQTDATLQIVDEAENGSIAIEKVRALQPDLVIMDIHMPHVNGIAATKHITTYYPFCAVIGVSADNDRCTRREMEKAGSTAFIAKEDFEMIPALIKGITRIT